MIGSCDFSHLQQGLIAVHGANAEVVGDPQAQAFSRLILRLSKKKKKTQKRGGVQYEIVPQKWEEKGEGEWEWEWEWENNPQASRESTEVGNNNNNTNIRLYGLTKSVFLLMYCLPDHHM